MILRIKEHEIDVWNLFVHDKYDVGALDEDVVAKWLTEQLSAMLPQGIQSILIRSPSETGLFRFTAEFVNQRGDVRSEPRERPHRAEDVRRQFPPWLVDALRKLVHVEGEV